MTMYALSSMRLAFLKSLRGEEQVVRRQIDTEANVSDMLRRLRERYPSYPNLEFIQVGDKKILAPKETSQELLSLIAEVIRERPKGAINCFDVAEHIHDMAPQFDVITTERAEHFYSSHHTINFGLGGVLDGSNDGNTRTGADAFWLPLPESEEASLPHFLELASLVHGGKWNYLGKEGLVRLREIVDEARRRRMAVRL